MLEQPLVPLLGALLTLVQTTLPRMATNAVPWLLQLRDQHFHHGFDPSRPPERYLAGCYGDVKEAEKRWKATLQWRRQVGADSILQQPHPYFDVIKEAYPHFYCMYGRDGSPVYIERSAQVHQERLRRAGVAVDKLIWHYIYTSEFLYEKLCPNDRTRTITVLDLAGVRVKDLAGEPFEFLRRTMSIAQDHYPERCKAVLLVNAPPWFSFMWRRLMPMVNGRTKNKIKIVGAGRPTFEAIKEFVDPSKIPVEYGGKLKLGNTPDSCRFNSPEEVRLREHVYTMNFRHGVKMVTE